MEENKKLYAEGWNKWRKFSNPQKGDYLYAPLGFGVYQLKNAQTDEFVLFGKSKHPAQRMTSILPSPYGTGTRKNPPKRNYVLNNLNDIVYRTMAFKDDNSAKSFELYIKSLHVHIFNT